VPADDVLTVECKAIGSAEKFTLRITNKLGELIRQEELAFKENGCRMRTDNLPEGVYYLQFQTKVGTAYRKIVISR
jgi:hypothetical protein